MKPKFSLSDDYRKILEAVSEVAIIAYTDKRGRITFANENFCRISGFSMAELYNQDHRLLNSGYHEKDFFKTMYETVKSGNIWRGDVRNKKKDGTYYWVDTQIIPILDDAGEIESFASIRFDITERKMMERTLLEMEKLASTLELAKSVAHEINNPLLIIELCCKGLNRDMNEAGPNLRTRKKVYKIIEQSKRIALTIKELKYLSRRKENGQIKLTG